MNDTAKHRINLVLSMDNPMQKKAWDVLTEYPPGSRTSAICRSVRIPPAGGIPSGDSATTGGQAQSY